MDKVSFGKGLVGVGIIATLIAITQIGGEVAITTVALATITIGIALINVGRCKKHEQI
ncbi:hypothetical protein [Pelosinus propionicus]|uniref:Uncharacterized protein n=1 Tax=Pelosinus propionicus DSM 13327 TaxID=1123291 RepID=A0A1I4PSW9_9FIRM|nr:hypothetical protein [Pelosinus propionicus]SFM30951.1 hypothetical protein SAMN04490355_107216 [Pelosinus propionicus DSM 13327]